MTILDVAPLALDTVGSSHAPNSSSGGQSTTSLVASPSRAESVSLPRFNLRKRSMDGDRDRATLVMVNSAFLDGLFADVAEAEVNSVSESSEDLSDSHIEYSPAFKKSRISLTKSVSRCAKSYKNLCEALVSPTSNTDDIFYDSTNTAIARDLQKEDSLFFQLSCVSESTNYPNTSIAIDAAKLAFPHLPASVSNSSCNTTLTRNLSDLQMSHTENTKECGYGWFVEMDDDCDSPSSEADPYSQSQSDLAFVAPTAPKASNHDAEVEWAQAADTVDDVLGDFF